MSRIVIATLILLLLSSVGLAPPTDVAASDTAIGPTQTAACGDLLLALHHKPPHLNFHDCRSDTVYGLKALVADYRVEGLYAQVVEGYFIKVAKMPALGFYCCGWDSIGPGGRDGSLRDGAAYYEIAMTSGETLLNRRDDWPRVPWFTVTVTRYLEEP